MTELEFFDTNILLYAKIDDATSRHEIAKTLVEQKVMTGEPYISVQVINEFTANALRKGKELSEIEDDIDELLKTFNVLPLTPSISKEAFRITRRYQFSFWDSLIVATALKAGCSGLYTEDLQNGQIIDESLKIVNPFRYYENAVE
jgi:predicted nucleic acid-binding protein